MSWKIVNTPPAWYMVFWTGMLAAWGTVTYVATKWGFIHAVQYLQRHGLW